MPDKKQDKLEKLKQVLTLVSESLTKEEFINAFKMVLDYVKKIDDRNLKEIEVIKQNLAALGEATIKKSEKDIETAKNEALKALQTIISKLEPEFDRQTKLLGERLEDLTTKLNDKLAEVDQKVQSVRDGKDADEEAMLLKLENDLPKLGERIRDALELLEGDNRLDKSAIKGLEEELKALSKKVDGQKVVAGGAAKTRIIRIDLSSQLNGVLKTFFLGTHFGIISVDSSSAPFGAFREGENQDYYESGKNIVFTSNVNAAISLAEGQSLIVKVLK